MKSHQNNYKIIDILENKKYIDLLNKKLYNIENKFNKDKLINNYSRNKLEYEKYDCFHVLLDDDEIIAFSAVQSFNFPKNVSRVLTRTFYFEEARNKLSSKIGGPSFATTCFLPIQIDFCKNKNKELIFISMEKIKRKKIIQNMKKYLTNIYKDEWRIYEGMVLVCPNEKSASCWQNVIYLNFVENKNIQSYNFNFISYDEYNEKFDY